MFVRFTDRFIGYKIIKNEGRREERRKDKNIKVHWRIVKLLKLWYFYYHVDWNIFTISKYSIIEIKLLHRWKIIIVYKVIISIWTNQIQRIFWTARIEKSIEPIINYSTKRILRTSKQDHISNDDKTILPILEC